MSRSPVFIFSEDEKSQYWVSVVLEVIDLSYSIFVSKKSTWRLNGKASTVD